MRKKSRQIITLLLAAIMAILAVPMDFGLYNAVAAESDSDGYNWNFSVFGNGTSVSKAAYTGSVEAGNLTINTDTGKLIQASTDGVAFYYTSLPSDINFTFRAKVTSNAWELSNGQEGFGLMAADRVPESGTKGPYWNNSYMAGAMRVIYYYDMNKMSVSTGNTGKYVLMRLGIAASEKTGVTKENLSQLEAYDTPTVQKEFNTAAYPLETSAGEAYAKGEKVYDNVVANGTVPTLNGSAVLEGTSPAAITDMYITIQKNNTGYFITYEDTDGKSVTKKYYDADALGKLDKDNVYVGFFTSGKVNATFSDITLTTSLPENDVPAEERPVEKVPVKLSFKSASETGIRDYEFMFTANCDGKAAIVDKLTGATIVDNIEVKADVLVKAGKVKLIYGENKYRILFTPAAGYKPGEYKEMESYETVSLGKTIVCQTYGDEGGLIWVAPAASGNGTKDNPTDIYTAVKFIGSGQTIILKEGTYLLDNAITINRGINGNANSRLAIMGDREASKRPVLDFQNVGTGMSLAGDYWLLKGFDITGATKTGLQISGSYNIAEQINSYYNKNTGISISAQSSSDTKDIWPSFNTVLNCTSYGNADEGYEDADGFGAKITCGAGNVFDGCIAHHNADDGWDLFAKVETGNIGSVTIRNSVSYANGYLEDGTNAGNGNGFKLGGENLTGRHMLENCIAYDNKAKGIDSNSCPDVIIRDCISFNNGTQNVALYTTASVVADTDFSVLGVISYRTKNTSLAEYINLLGTQDKSKVYGVSNYYWDKSLKKSLNNAKQEVSADWFKSLDTSVSPTRYQDGTINMNGLLEFTDKGLKAISADYTKVDEAIAKFEALTPSEYKNFMIVTEAVENVVRGLRNSRQADVDNMAAAITSAIADLIIVEAETQQPTEPETETQQPTEPETETQRPTEPETEIQRPTEPETQRPTESETEIQRPTESETEIQQPTEPETQRPTESETEIQQPTDNVNDSPGTGDGNQSALYAVFAFMSFIFLAGALILKNTSDKCCTDTKR